MCETPYEVQSQTPNSTRIALPTPKMFCLKKKKVTTLPQSMTLIKLKLFPDLNAGVLDNTHSTHCTLQKFIIVIKFFTHSLGCHKENGSFCLQDTVKYVSSN